MDEVAGGRPDERHKAREGISSSREGIAGTRGLRKGAVFAPANRTGSNSRASQQVRPSDEAFTQAAKRFVLGIV
jgi:hypothetical protein